MPRLRPLAEPDQMLFEPHDGITERPVLMVIFGPIARRIVAGGMCGRTIGHQFDQGGAGAGARPLGCPLRYRIDREKVVAVDANARDTVARAARRERALLAARVALKSRYRPLIVHHVQNDRRRMDRGKQKSVMENRLGASALPKPTRREMIFALDRRRHRPADGLREL